MSPPTSRSHHRYKGFDVLIVPRDVVHFGYEIGGMGGSVIRSLDGFRTEEAARDAARAFVDEVDRRIGLGPIDSQRA